MGKEEEEEVEEEEEEEGGGQRLIIDPVVCGLDSPDGGCSSVFQGVNIINKGSRVAGDEGGLTPWPPSSPPTTTTTFPPFISITHITPFPPPRAPSDWAQRQGRDPR